MKRNARSFNLPNDGIGGHNEVGNKRIHHIRFEKFWLCLNIKELIRTNAQSVDTAGALADLKRIVQMCS